MNDTVAVIRELLPRPVVLYGTGDGADKIIALLERTVFRYRAFSRRTGLSGTGAFIPYP